MFKPEKSTSQCITSTKQGGVTTSDCGFGLIEVYERRMKTHTQTQISAV